MSSIRQRSDGTSAFKRHLSFYDLDRNGVIYLSESLRANLSLGLDFPIALISAIGLQIYYGNTRPFIFGPLNGIDISRISHVQERTMLENMDFTYRVVGSGFDRQALVEGSGAQSLIDKLHVTGLWALAANADGLVSMRDVRRCQDGSILWEIQKRRMDRSDVLPLYRGGPISVSGHSWFVDKLFGVQVYQAGFGPKDR
jgi:hypothetical protein